MRATRLPIPVLRAASGRRSLAALIAVTLLTAMPAAIPASDFVALELIPHLSQAILGQPGSTNKKKDKKAKPAPVVKKDATLDPALQRDKTALPAGYKIPPEPLPDLHIDKPLPFVTKTDPKDPVWKEHVKKFKDYRDLLRKGNFTDPRANRELLRYGIQYRLAQLTQRSVLFPSDEDREKVAKAEENKRIEGPVTLEKLRDDILKDLHDTNAFNGGMEIRDAFLEILCEEAPKLLDNNFYVRFSVAEILSNINNRDEDKTKPIPVVEEPCFKAVKALLDLVNDPKQHCLYKLHPVQALARICRHKKCTTDDRFAIIEALLNQMTAAKKLPEWYGKNLAEALGQLGDPNDRTRQPVVVDALVNVLKDQASFTYRVRIQAAHSLGRIPLEGYRKTDEIAVEFLRLASQMAVDYEKDAQNPRWKLYFVILYFGFNPSDATEKAEKKGLLGQVESKPVLAGTKTVVTEAYQHFLPLAQVVLGAKGATPIPEQLRKVKTWMDARGKPLTTGPVANNK